MFSSPRWPRWLLLPELGLIALAAGCTRNPAFVSDAGPDKGHIEDYQRIYVEGGPTERGLDRRLDSWSNIGCPAPTPPAPKCGAAQCGNGKIDSCQKCSPTPNPGPWGPDAGVWCTTISEACDGGSLNNQTCTSQGYVSGTLACGAWCDFDASSCATCVPSAHVQSCGRANIDAVNPGSVAMVATELEIAVAWISGGGAHFARFKHDLSLIMQSKCMVSDAHEVALAATQLGYVLGVSRGKYPSQVIEIRSLSTAGEPRGSVQVIPGYSPYLVTRREPGKPIDGKGGPLLVFTLPSPYRREARLLNPDDSLGTVVGTLIAAPIESAYVSGVFTGDGFLYAERESFAGVTLVRIHEFPNVVTKNSPASSTTEYPQLAWNGVEARLTYADFGMNPIGTRWMRIDRNGIALAPSIILATGPQQFNRSPIVMVGNGDTLVFLGGYSGTTDWSKHLDVMRVGPTGNVVTAPYPLVKDPNLARSHLMVSRGPDAIALWLRGGYPGGIDLARITP